LSCCVGGTTRKYAIVRPLVPTIWPIQEGFDLIQKEITTLKKMRFFSDYSLAQSLFGSQSSSSSVLHVHAMNAHNIVRSANANYWPTICGGKKVKRPFVFQITQHTNN
jgi:hypothetical protein